MNDDTINIDALASGLEYATYTPAFSLYPPPTAQALPMSSWYKPDGAVWPDGTNIVNKSASRAWINDPVNFIYDEATKLYRGFVLCSSITNQQPINQTLWMEVVSNDLVTWTPFRLPFRFPFDDGAIGLYGGCQVVDTNGDSGFAPGSILYFISRPAMAQTPNQQGVSRFVAPCHGVTPIYDKDVLLAPPVGVNGMKQGSGFRDSRVVWCEEANLWICAVTIDYGIAFYTSIDTTSWTFLQVFDFTQYQQIECPSPVRINIDGYGYKWFLVFSFKNYGGVYRQCVGYVPLSWSGTEFTADTMTPKLLNYGEDYYAQAVSMVGDDAFIWAWIGDWAYSGSLETQGYANTVSQVSRLVGGQDPTNGFVLKCVWLDSLKSRYNYPVMDRPYATLSSTAPYSLPTKTPGRSYMLEIILAKWTPNDWCDSVTVSICSGPTGVTKIILDIANNYISIDRSNSGILPLNSGDSTAQSAFKAVRGGPTPRRAEYNIKIVYDVCFVEVMVNDGDAYLSSVILPTEDNFDVNISAQGSGYALLNAVLLYK